jgi:hypothetical protein
VRIGTAPLCLVGGEAAVEEAHHDGLGCALFEERKSGREISGKVENLNAE